MAKTYKNVLDEARVLLQDDDSSSYRVSEAKMIDILNRALQALVRIRPDACYDLFADNSLGIPELVESSPGAGQTIYTSTFALETQFYNPLLHYVVGLTELIDDEYSEDGRAMALLSQFKGSIVSV